MNQVARRLGRTLALVLPVTMVLSGTLAVTRVPWSPSPAESQVLTASADQAASRGGAASDRPEDVLLHRLLTKLHREDPGAALDALQRAVQANPTLGRHCQSIAGKLGRAAVTRYGTDKARAYAKPVCDSSFTAGMR